jgi:hypothetical protein
MVWLSRQQLRVAIAATSVARAFPTPGVIAMPSPISVQAEVKEFNIEQLDAMLAPIMLYPDELLTQILRASTYPSQVVAAARSLTQGDNQKQTGEAPVKALIERAAITSAPLHQYTPHQPQDFAVR